MPEVKLVKDMVAIQPGSVVSQAVVDRPAGTVTLFAFDRGQGLSEHSAPYDALVLGIAGEAEITISGKPYRVREGEMLIMPAGEPHALQSITAFKMMLVMIRGKKQSK